MFRGILFYWVALRKGALILEAPIESRSDANELVRQLEEAQAMAKIGSWSFDLISNHLTWSCEHYKIFEIPEGQSQEVLYQLYRSKIRSQDLGRLDELVERAKVTGQGFIYDHQLNLEDGRIKFVQGIGKVTKDRDGKAIRVSGTCQDITDRVQAHEQNKFVLEALEIGVWKFNPTDQSVVWDQGMYQLFDLKEADFPGHYQAWESALTPEAKEKAVEELGQALRGEKEFDTTFEIQTRSRGRRFIAGRGKVIRNSAGQATMMYGINYDRTQEVELERQYESVRLTAIHNAKLASLGELSAGVAHEINNPLAIIAGSIGLLEKFKDHPEKFSEKISSVLRSVQRISKIVLGLKKFSRASENLVHGPAALSDIVKEALVMTEVKANSHGTLVYLDTQSDAKILCEEVEIEQVVVNLVSNAIDAVKSLSERWVKIAIFEDQSKLVLQVHDSGPGMTSEVESELFQPFFTTKPLGEGTGLGLSIAKGILDQHNASITINRTHRNTCFEIRFPMVEVTHAP